MRRGDTKETLWERYPVEDNVHGVVVALSRGAEDIIANDLIRRQRDIPLVLPHGGPGIRRLIGSGF